MVKLNGQIVTYGCVTGILLPKYNYALPKLQLIDYRDENLIFDYACELAKSQYETMVEYARLNFGNVVATMVWVHQQLILDLDFHSKIKEILQVESCSVNDAIMKATNEIIAPMLQSTDAYLRERSNDIIYVAKWLSQCCYEIRTIEENRELVKLSRDNSTILVGEDFGFEDVIMAKRERIVGLIDRKGSIYSHAVFIAKEISLPMLVQVDEDVEKYFEHSALLNATLGFVEIE